MVQRRLRCAPRPLQGLAWIPAHGLLYISTKKLRQVLWF